MAKRVQIEIEVVGDAAAQRSVRQVGSAIEDLGTQQTPVAGRGLDDLRARLATMRGSLDELAVTTSTRVPAGLGASTAAMGVATVAAAALGTALYQTGRAAVDAFAETDEGARKLARLAETADRAKRAYGSEFQGEVRAAAGVLQQLGNFAEASASGLATAFRVAAPIFLLVKQTADSVNLALQTIQGPESVAADALARLKKGEDEVTAALARAIETRANLRADGVLRAGEDAEEHARILEQRARGLEQFRQLEVGLAREGADPGRRIGIDFDEEVRRIRELGAQFGVAQAQIDAAIEQAADNALRKTEELAEKELQLRVKAEEESATQIREIRERQVGLVERDLERRLAAHERVEGQIVALEQRAAFAGLDAFEAVEERRKQTVAAIEADINVTAEQIARAQAAAARIATAEIDRENQRIFDEQTRRLEQQGREWELFWDRVSRGAKSTSDFLSNLWSELANDFRRSVVQMVGALVFGQGQTQRVFAGAGAGGGGGGPLGGFASVLFGGGGGFGGPGLATPPFVGSFASDGIQAPRIPGSAAGSIPGGLPGGGLGGIFGGIFGRGGGRQALGGLGNFGPALGLMLGLQGGSPLSGALLGGAGVIGGTALAGGLAAASVGAGFFGGAGVALAGLASNPVGLAILGGVVATGAIAGLLSRNGKKRKATTVANDGFEQIDEIVERFKDREVQYESALASMDRLWLQMESEWKKIGGSVGQRSIDSQSIYYQQRVAQVERIQGERERRITALAGLPQALFHSGGYVPGVGDLPATLQGGEFVIRRETVERVGVPALERINSGAGGGGGSVVIHFNGPVNDGMRGWLRSSEFTDQVIKAVRRGKGEGRLR